MEVKLLKSKYLKGIMDHNTYVLNVRKEAVIVDASAELEDVLAEVGERKVLAILMTHLHFDHFWNIEKYIEKFDCPVYIVEGEEHRFEDMSINCSPMIRQKISKFIDKKNVVYYPKDGETLKIGTFSFGVFHTPGHTSDCVCLKIGDELFTGDTVFKDAVGRTDLPTSSLEDLMSSLKRIKNLKFKNAYPGHSDTATQKQILKVIDYYVQD